VENRSACSYCISGLRLAGERQSTDGQRQQVLYHLGPFALAHAWCVDHHGVVHDPTWPDGAGLAYLGVPFTSVYLDTFGRTRGEARVLYDFYLDDYALLRQGVPASAMADVGTDLRAVGGV
jgi:hypothetical protein